MKNDIRVSKLEENKSSEVDPMVYKYLKFMYGNNMQFSQKEMDDILTWIKINDPEAEKTIIDRIKVIENIGTKKELRG